MNRGRRFIVACTVVGKVGDKEPTAEHESNDQPRTC
jgi:hypothetical protein